MTPHCPKCEIPMELIVDDDGKIWQCPKCGELDVRWNDDS